MSWYGEGSSLPVSLRATTSRFPRLPRRLRRDAAGVHRPRFRSGWCAASARLPPARSVWGALGMSAIIFSGAAQIIAAQLLAAGAPVAVIILTCVVMGLRFLMYSAAIAPYLRAAVAAAAAGARVPAHRPGVRGGDPALRRRRGSARGRAALPRRRLRAVARAGRSRTSSAISPATSCPRAGRWSSRCRCASSRSWRRISRCAADRRRRARRGSRSSRSTAADAAQPDRRRRARHRRRHGDRAREGAMDATLKLWLVIVVVGALNYLSRLSFIAFFARRERCRRCSRARSATCRRRC